ncbi:hypothetical protein [Adhaeretor mobilis]|uniref:Uncharacterized protein n=1 Tax=Adhaeretor mobilis TaxID=1930276 RepID=A0A517N203_9BACT|nr:hypothetical protein [Adhaeretor mobilis]QDT01169.1 hypothetical protein HG15A2_45110 [Adhaeretor mobilis]
MSQKRSIQLALVVVTLSIGCLSSGAIAKGTGLWRLPSSTAQYFGCGNGPGHHAPMIRSPGYQPPQVQRLKFIPAKQGPFCKAGTCGVTAGFQSMPAEADIWSPDNLNGAFRQGPPQQVLPQRGNPQHAQSQMPMHLQPQFAPQRMPMQAHPRVPGQQQSVLFAPPTKRTLPLIQEESTLTEEIKKGKSEMNAEPQSDNLVTPADEEESRDSLLDEDDLNSFRTEDPEADLEEPAMPDAEPRSAPQSKDDTPQTDQAKGPRVWTVRH